MKPAKKLFLIVSLFVAVSPFLAIAQQQTIVINPNIPGTYPVTAASGPGAFVENFYQFALMIAGVLALGAIVYGGVKYAASTGNPSAQSDAKEWILNALYGLLLLGGAYIILFTINPNLTALNLPVLQPVSITTPITASGTIPVTGAQGTCSGHNPPSCYSSPAVNKILACIKQTTGFNITATTFQGSHNANSCHFGGRLCTDGGHAVDWGINGVRAGSNNTMDLNAMMAAANACGASTGVPVSCRCESAGGAEIGISCNAANANHVHCNVDTASCGCN